MALLDRLGADELIERAHGVLGATWSQKVTGPSFTRLTCMSSPNTPVSTRGIHSSSLATNLSYSRSALSGPAAVEKLGRVPLFVSAARVNWGTARIWPFTSFTDRFILPSPSAKMR